MTDVKSFISLCGCFAHLRSLANHWDGVEVAVTFGYVDMDSVDLEQKTWLPFIARGLRPIIVVLTVIQKVVKQPRTGATFRSAWQARECVLTEDGLYVFSEKKKRAGGKNAKKEKRLHGSLKSLILIEMINGVRVENSGKKEWIFVVSTFEKDSRFRVKTNDEAVEWEKTIIQAVENRRKKAQIHSKGSGVQREPPNQASKGEGSLNMVATIATDIGQVRDVQSLMDEEINVLMSSYLKKRNGILDELMKRELASLRLSYEKKRLDLLAEMQRREIAVN